VRKAGRRARRRARSKGGKREPAWFESNHARTAADRRPPTWLDRLPVWAVFALCTGSVVGIVSGHYALWQWVIPSVGEVVGRIPVVSTVVGWLFAGGAFVAVGVAVANDKTAREATRRRLRLIAYVWCGLATLCLPIGWAEEAYLPTDYWAGVFAGSYGTAASPLVAAVIAFLWWLAWLGVEGSRRPKNGLVGWALISYGVSLLVWGSTLLRT
jgi:MFS family permease